MSKGVPTYNTPTLGAIFSTSAPLSPFRRTVQNRSPIRKRVVSPRADPHHPSYIPNAKYTNLDVLTYTNPTFSQRPFPLNSYYSNNEPFRAIPFSRLSERYHRSPFKPNTALQTDLCSPYNPIIDHSITSTNKLMHLFNQHSSNRKVQCTLNSQKSPKRLHKFSDILQQKSAKKQPNEELKCVQITESVFGEGCEVHQTSYKIAKTHSNVIENNRNSSNSQNTPLIQNQSKKGSPLQSKLILFENSFNDNHTKRLFKSPSTIKENSLKNRQVNSNKKQTFSNVIKKAIEQSAKKQKNEKIQQHKQVKNIVEESLTDVICILNGLNSPLKKHFQEAMVQMSPQIKRSGLTMDPTL